MLDLHQSEEQIRSISNSMTVQVINPCHSPPADSPGCFPEISREGRLIEGHAVDLTNISALWDYM